MCGSCKGATEGEYQLPDRAGAVQVVREGGMEGGRGR